MEDMEESGNIRWLLDEEVVCYFEDCVIFVKFDNFIFVDDILVFIIMVSDDEMMVWNDFGLFFRC